MKWMESVRSAIKGQVHRMVGFDGGRAPEARPDEGLFGPDSVCWNVHRDFTTMMIGGVSALLLQMLHPAALAGVLDHSGFRDDMSGRLRRTAQFISGTTYGPRERALSLIERVRRVHERVQGELPDGTLYRANDPELLTWVHVAEVSSFLRAYLRYQDPFMPGRLQDRYFAEVAEIARRLGAEDVPVSRRDVRIYMRAVRADLRADVRTREIAGLLLSQPASKPALAPAQALIMEAAVDLLPDWASDLHGRRVPPARTAAVRAGVLGMRGVMRWAMRG
ncbi:oxygenase MpaB family protein [Terrihabitans sp. B22-R8]|uniref:oxygenase MpaB family protein n=1 Tax=Terrihabitans sp. B22-R8 TaxID=3425128 RepID=UPI00403CCF04